MASWRFLYGRLLWTCLLKQPGEPIRLNGTDVRGLVGGGTGLSGSAGQWIDSWMGENEKGGRMYGR